MGARFSLVAVLVLCSLIFRQTPEPSGVHTKEWTERRAQYFSEPRIKETESFLEITANDPRPLDAVLGALAQQHGWHINYEEPQYGTSDLVDDTASSWLGQHPNGRHVYVIGGGAFHVKIPIDGYFPDDPMQILPPLIDAYNRSGNPGKFQLRVVSQDSFDVVPTASAVGPQTPLLDTVMSFDASDDVDAYATLDRFCGNLSRKTGQNIGFGTPTVSNLLLQARVQLHSVDQPAREILRQIYKQVASTDSWRLLYDPDSNGFSVRMRR